MALIEFLSGLFHLLAGFSYLALCLKHKNFDVYACLALAMIGIGICLLVSSLNSKARNH